MATFRPGSGELVEAALRPMLAEETKAAEGWPELHLNPATWIEGDQVWVLELQPYDCPSGDLEEMHQLASDEKAEGTSSSGQSRQSPVKESGVPECQSWSDETSLQTKRTNISDGEAFSQSLKLTTEQSTHTRNLHNRDQCGKGFRSPSDLVQRYQHAHSREETARQGQSQTVSYSQSALAPISLPLQSETMSIDSCETMSPKQMQTTEQSTPTENLHICDQCGEDFQWLSELIQHMYAHSGGETAKLSQCQSEIPSPNTLAPVPLQDKENLLANSCETLCQKSTLVMDQSTRTKNVQICDQCGKGYRWPSDLARHQHIHHGRKTTKRRKHQSGAGLLVPVPLQLQEENMFVSPVQAFTPKTKRTTDQSTRTKNQHICDQCGKSCQLAQRYQRHHPGRIVAKQKEHQSEAGTKNLYICDQCGKGYRWRSDLARHQRINHGRKTTKRRKHQSEAGPLVSAPLPLQEEKTFVSATSAFRPKTKVMADRNTRTNNLHFCDQCGMGYQWLSHLTQHQRVHHGMKAGKQRERQSKASPLLVSVPLPLQEEKTFVSSESTFRSKLKPMTDQSTRPQNKHICHLCGKGHRYPSDLKRHQSACYRRKAAEQRERLSEASSLVSVTLPLQAEKTFVAPDHSTHIKTRHICHLCGKGHRSPSDLKRHQSACYRRKAAGKRVRRSKASSLVASTLPLQAEKTFVSPVSIFRPVSMLAANQSMRTENVHTCDQCWKGCQQPCGHVQRFQCHHSVKKATRQGQCQSDSYSRSVLAPISLPLQTENTFAGSCETVSRKSKPMTEQSTRTKSLPIRDQCGKGFQCPSGLMHHAQCIHSGENAAVQNLHKCDHYGTSFQCPSGLAPHQFVHFGEQATIQRPCQSEAHSPSPLASVPLQAENIFATSPEIFSPESMVMADQNTHAMNPHICDQYQKGFWWPSEPARHPCVHSGWGQCCSKGCSHLVSYPLQAENSAANACKTFHPNSKIVSDQSTPLHTCGQCGNACRREPPTLGQHEHVRPGDEVARQGHCPSAAACSPSPITSSPLPLQENTFTNSTQMRGWSIETQNLHICSHSGNCFQWPSSELTQHPCVHSWGGVARGDRCQLKIDDPNSSISVTTSLQVDSMLANRRQATSQNPKQMTDQSAQSKKPYHCDQSGEGFQWLSDLTQHADTHSREKPYSCAACGSQFRRKVQLKKHQKLHEETHDSDEEEEEGGYGEEALREDIQWLPPQGAEELCEPFASLKACEQDVCPTGASNSPRPLPPNTIWEIGVSGQPYILPLGHPCACGNCEACDRSTIDAQPTEPSSLGADDTACSDLTSPMSFCDTSTPIVLTASHSTDENVEDMLRKEGSPASPISIRQVRVPPAVASQNLEESPSRQSTEQDPTWVGEDKPYACRKCPKRFSRGDYLTRHLAVHQTEKPHRCKTCGKRFAHLSYLYKHKKLHRVQSRHRAALPLPRSMASPSRSMASTVRKPSPATAAAGRMLEVEDTFRKFALFRDTSTTSNEMTSRNFSKMLKECGVVDGKAVTNADVDIVFNKYKSKGSRNINYVEFVQAIKDLSGKRFKGEPPEEALAATFKLFEGKEPAPVGASRSDLDGGLQKIYTSSHKNLCDEGIKAGSAGSLGKTGYVRAYKDGTNDETH